MGHRVEAVGAERLWRLGHTQTSEPHHSSVSTEMGSAKKTQKDTGVEKVIFILSQWNHYTGASKGLLPGLKVAGLDRGC